MAARRNATTRRLVACAALLSAAAVARADEAPQPLPSVTVLGNYDNGVGTSDAASEGSVNARLIESRPVLRTGELLEFVPGLIVTQHSGDGKANQYFLRGFNLDHGTDFYTEVDGMPVNMRTHAHGQGYTDLNFVIPELVQRIDYRKGPYAADDGDFASAGSARLRLVDRLEQPLLSVTGGQHDYGRGLAAGSTDVGGGTLLGALDVGYSNGPWDNAERARRASGVLRYALGTAERGITVTAMGYAAHWRSTDQIPTRAVDEDLIDRFGAIDASDGGSTARFSLSLAGRTANAIGPLTGELYAIASRLDLFSNFTYFLDDPVHGDQFEQFERRKLYGGSLRQGFDVDVLGFETSNAIGLQARDDHIDPIGLYRTEDRQRLATTREDRVRESSIGAYFENRVRWTSWLRSVAGVRYDAYRFKVASDTPENSGTVRDHIGSPKLSLVFGPWARTELFLNYGQGFHSNDARGTTATVAPADGTAVERVAPLVKTRGIEAGARTEWIPGLQTSLSVWQLKLDSELVFSGDAGDTEPSRASRRYGIEWNNHYIAARWLLFDVDLALSHARSTQDDPVGDAIPGSVDKVASLGVTIAPGGPWSGQVNLRYFGPRPLIEDDSVRSASTTLLSARIAYRVSRNVTVALDGFNLMNRHDSDIDYYYASRLPGEPAGGVDDVHFHPVEPRTIRGTVTARF